jgi:hypothetical protein
MALPARQLEQRARLLEELSDLLKLAGHGDFLFGPILRPTPDFFPDDWRPDLAGARALFARLMAYARLHGIPTLLRDDGDPTWQRDVDVDATLHRNAAAWFAGANDLGTYLFGVKERQLEHADSFAGIFAHETAQAWRFRHDVTHSSQSVEEGLTDLTTVFLGFGVLTANIAWRADEEVARLVYLSSACALRRTPPSPQPPRLRERSSRWQQRPGGRSRCLSCSLRSRRPGSATRAQATTAARCCR